jgi:hypothetical protein
MSSTWMVLSPAAMLESRIESALGGVKGWQAAIRMSGSDSPIAGEDERVRPFGIQLK